MKKTLRILFLLMLAAGAAKAQFSPYNYTVNLGLDRGAGNDTTANGVNGSYYESPRPASATVIGRFFPNITAPIPYRLRAISYQTDAQFTLSNEKLSVKTSTGGVAKFAAYNIANATGVVKIAFDLDLTNYTGIGALTFAFGNIAGNGTINSSSNNTTTANAGIFASFRIVKSGNLVTQFRSADGSTNTNTSKYLIKAEDSQRVEIFVNSTSNEISYSYGTPAASVPLSSNTYHVYVNGVRYDEDFPKVGTAYIQTAVNAFAVNTANSTTAETVAISNLSFTYKTETNLPVSLTSFNASKAQNGIQLNWQTASEQNNQYFDILRSVNGKDFVSIGTIKGAGTTSEAKSYAFTDYNPVSGYNYYKLKQVDGDGKSTVYDDKVQAVNFGLESQEISAYSLENKLIVKLNSANETLGNITLTTIAGQQVISKNVNVTKGDNEFAIDLGHIRKGIYVSKIQLGELSKIVKIAK